MKAKADKIADNLHTYSTLCIHTTFKKYHIVNNMGLAR